MNRVDFAYRVFLSSSSIPQLVQSMHLIHQYSWLTEVPHYEYVKVFLLCLLLVESSMCIISNIFYCTNRRVSSQPEVEILCTILGCQLSTPVKRSSTDTMQLLYAIVNYFSCCIPYNNNTIIKFTAKKEYKCIKKNK